MTTKETDTADVSERDFMERSMLSTKTIIHVGERPVPCERSFDASFYLFLLLYTSFISTYLEKMAFQSHQQNIFYETSANEIGKESPEDFEMSMKFLHVLCFTLSFFFTKNI